MCKCWCLDTDFFPNNLSSSAARPPVDEPALATILTHDHAKDLCASELSLEVLLIDWLIDNRNTFLLSCNIKDILNLNKHFFTTQFLIGPSWSPGKHKYATNLQGHIVKNSNLVRVYACHCCSLRLDVRLPFRSKSSPSSCVISYSSWHNSIVNAVWILVQRFQMSNKLWTCHQSTSRCCDRHNP